MKEFRPSLEWFMIDVVLLVALVVAYHACY